MMRAPGETSVDLASSWLPFSDSRQFKAQLWWRCSASVVAMLVCLTSASAQTAAAGNSTIPKLADSMLRQAVPKDGALSLTGSMPQLASGGGWETTLSLVNTSSVSGEAMLNLWGDPGGALTLQFGLPQTSSAVTGSSLNEAIPANALLLLDTDAPESTAAQVGSAQLFTDGTIDGFAIFRYQPSGQEAVVPLEKRNAASYVLAFDNTRNLSTGVAVANVSGTAADIPVTLRDETGASLGTSMLSVEANGHTSFMLSQSYPATAGVRGTVEFDTPSGGQISVLGLRSAPIQGDTNAFAITTLPLLANVVAGTGSVAQVAAGFGWQTTFTLVNVGGTSASAHLAFFDNNGTALPLSLSFPQTGTSASESAADAVIPAGATLIITANDTGASQVGSAQLTTTGSIGAFAIFRYNPTGQEAVVPLQTGTANGYLLTYDNTSGLTNGVAVANQSSDEADIPVTVRDDIGATLSTTTITLAPNGHTMFLLTDPTSGFPMTAGKRGTVEFDTPGGGQISIVGLRSHQIHAVGPTKGDFAVTTIPPLNTVAPI